jgi:SsrA-binding protein
LKKNLCKVELAVAKGKQQHDKRRDIAKKTAQREMEKAFRRQQKGDY